MYNNNIFVSSLCRLYFSAGQENRIMLATNFAKDNKAAAKAGRQAEKSAELFSRRPRMKIFEEED